MRVDSDCRAIILAVVLAWAAGPALKGQESSCVTPELDKPIAGLQPKIGTIVEILFGVGKQSGICFGLDIRDSAVLKERFSLSEAEDTLRKVLTAIGGRARYSARDGVVSVQVGSATPKDWLDVAVPVFRTEKVQIELASSKLFEHLLALAYPGTGTAGSTPFSFESPLVQPFTKKGGTVASILNDILMNSARAGIWFTVGPHPAQHTLPSNAFWTLLVYSDRSEVNHFRMKEAVEQPR